MKIPNPLAQFLLLARAQGREGAKTLHLILYLRFSGLWENLRALGPPHSSSFSHGARERQVGTEYVWLAVLCVYTTVIHSLVPEYIENLA